MWCLDVKARAPTEPCEIVTHHTALQRYLVSLSICLLGLLDQLPLWSARWCFLHTGICFLWIAIICLCTAFVGLAISFKALPWCICTSWKDPHIAHGAPWLDNVFSSLQAIAAKGFFADDLLILHIISRNFSGPWPFPFWSTCRYSGIQLGLSLLSLGLGIWWYRSNSIPISFCFWPWGVSFSSTPTTDLTLIPIGLLRSFPAILKTAATVFSLNLAAYTFATEYLIR